MFGAATDDPSVVETPALVIQALVEMEAELARISVHEKREYGRCV
jgi:hypothetical protein